MLNKKWRKRIIDTEYINERAIKTTILVNRQHIDLIFVYFPVHSNQSLEETSMLSWDLEKERNVQVLASTPLTKVTRKVTG